jgi:hypothetical protein
MDTMPKKAIAKTLFVRVEIEYCTNNEGTILPDFVVTVFLFGKEIFRRRIIL